MHPVTGEIVTEGGGEGIVPSGVEGAPDEGERGREAVIKASDGQEHKNGCDDLNDHHSRIPVY
jgi:hypothetical protein